MKKKEVEIMARSVENSRGESWTADGDPSPSHLSQHISKETPLSLCVYFHVCLENVELKPTMKWDVGGIDFFYASTDRAKDS